MAAFEDVGAHRQRPWLPWVIALSVAGLIIRVAALWHAPGLTLLSDPGNYHMEANHLAAGLGWINPSAYEFKGARLPSAYYPPLFPMVLAASSAVGASSYLAHQIWCCVIGSCAIPLAAYTGRLIANPRVGLIGAGVASVYPNLWMVDPLVLSETLSPVVVLIVLLTAYRFWQRPGMRRIVAVGGAIGIAVLARDELAALPALVLLPVALTVPDHSWRRRLAFFVAGGVAALIIVAPWIGYNLSRFDRPVLISDGLGPTLAFGNCDVLYHGKLTGSYSFACGTSAAVDSRADESVQSAQYQESALRYVGRHAGDLPRVIEARVGRTFGFYHPVDQVRLDAYLDRRPLHWALAGLATYYALVVLSIFGARRLRRLGVPTVPLLAMGVVVFLAVVLSWGQTRFRTTFEVSLVLLASVGLDSLLYRRAEVGLVEGP